MLINLRNALMAGKRLPYDAEVEYLESTGTQYVNTGVAPADDATFVICAAFTDLSTGRFGVVQDTLSGTYCYYFGVSGGRWIGAINSTSYNHNIAQADTSVHIFKTNNLGLYIDDVMMVAAENLKSTLPVYLANINGSVVAIPTKAKLYSCKIYDANNLLILDLIPVRKGTVGYLYDRVSGKLFGNAGTGDFVLGPDVVPVEYIESHGTEWIDTDLVATANNAFGAEIGFDTTVIDHGGTGTTNTVCICGANSYATSGFELRWQYGNASLVEVGGSYGNYVATRLIRNDILSKSIVAKNMNGHITYNADGANIVDRTATVADAGFVSGSVLLFGVRRGTSVQGITLLWAKMKYAKFYYNNNIAESLIPVRVGTEGAMMDVLTRRIYRNAGTGAFTYGNDLKYPIPA